MDRVNGSGDDPPRAVSSGRPDGLATASLVRVLIVDHSDLVRYGIRAILADLPRIDVVGQVATAADAIQAVIDLRPDVVLMDSGLPDQGGYTATTEIVARAGALAIVMLSSFDDAEHALQAFACGANAYISKNTTQAELLATILRTVAGETSVDPILGAKLLQALARSAGAPLITSQPDALTPRELDVLRLLACGRTNKEIAAGLVVAVGTVKVHVERIFGKLGTSTRSEAAVRAIELGIVEPAGDVVAGSRWDVNRESLRS
jgi:DNA-binding NarL/FixJ family response regulator